MKNFCLSDELSDMLKFFIFKFSFFIEKSRRHSGGLRNTVLGSNRRKRNVFKAHGVISVTPFALPSVHGLG